MFRTIVNRIPLVLVVAAIVSPVAQAANHAPRPESVATAFGFLAQQGLSQGQIEAWTIGVCSSEVKPSSCYVTPAESRLASRRLAEGFLQGTGLAPAQVTSLTEGGTSQSARVEGGFDWGDAGVGAGATLGVVALLAGLGAALTISRHNHRRQIPSS
jgi:hypothetical protein